MESTESTLEPSPEAPKTVADTTHWAKRLGTFLMCYGVVALLLSQLAWETGYSIVTDATPIAQAPPAGYTAVKPDTTLVWSKNGLDGKFRVDLVDSEGDFSSPTFTKELDGSQVNTPPLDPARTYVWRVTHVSSGMVSNTMKFHTAKHMYRF